MKIKTFAYCIDLNEGQIITHTYDDIFNGTLAKKKFIIDILRKNMEEHKKSQDEPIALMYTFISATQINIFLLQKNH